MVRAVPNWPGRVFLGPFNNFFPPPLKMSSISCAAVPVVRVEGGDSIGRSYAKKVGVASVLHCAS